MKTTSNKDINCHAPWRALFVDPEGFVRTDNQSSVVIGQLSDTESLIEIIKNNKLTNLQKSFSGKVLPMGCENCQKKESTIGHSRRIFFRHKLSLLEETPKVFRLEYLDLHLTSRCNLKCRMCNSESSTQWIIEDQHLNHLKLEGLNRPKNPRLRQASSETLKKLLRKPEVFNDLRYLALRGGEPLMEPLYLEVLDFLIAKGLSKNITLDLSTNGTIAEAKVLDRLHHFASVDFHLSIEGVGKLYQYIRGGDHFSIEDLEGNILKFRSIPNLKIIFATTLSVYNILNLDELIDWFLKIKTSSDEIILTNVVVKPNYLQYQIIPQDLKDVAKKRLQKVQPFLIEHCSLPQRKIKESGLDQVIVHLAKSSIEVEERDRLWEIFKKYNVELDKMRQTKLSEVLPELLDYF